MNHIVCAVYDVKAAAYMSPFFVPTIGVATRSFLETCIDRTHAFARWPEDYILYQLGDFDDQSGLITSLKAPAHVVSASEIIQQLQRRNAASQVEEGQS